MDTTRFKQNTEIINAQHATRGCWQSSGRASTLPRIRRLSHSMHTKPRSNRPYLCFVSPDIKSRRYTSRARRVFHRNAFRSRALFLSFISDIINVTIAVAPLRGSRAVSPPRTYSFLARAVFCLRRLKRSRGSFVTEIYSGCKAYGSSALIWPSLSRGVLTMSRDVNCKTFYGRALMHSEAAAWSPRIALLFSRRRAFRLYYVCSLLKKMFIMAI